LRSWRRRQPVGGEDLTKATKSFKQDVAQAYLVGFEAALEQAAAVHPTLDFSELGPGKIMVDGQLREDYTKLCYGM